VFNALLPSNDCIYSFRYSSLNVVSPVRLFRPMKDQDIGVDLGEIGWDGVDLICLAQDGDK
jgi:hypothetical protein